MLRWDDDAEFEILNERMAAELDAERTQALEIQIRRDEQSRRRPLELREVPGQKKLKRELRQEALIRLEEAARSQRDFEEVVAWWDKLDENRERRERRWNMVLCRKEPSSQSPFAVPFGGNFAAAISSTSYLTALLRCTDCWQTIFCQS